MARNELSLSICQLSPRLHHSHLMQEATTYKSMAILSHFHSWIGNCRNNLDDLWCSNFTCWLVKHLDKISLLNLCTPGAHILVPFRNVPSLSITKSRDWPCCTSNWTFCSWALLWYALTISKYTNRTLNRDIMHFFSHFNCNPWSIDSCSSFIIDLLPMLMCAKLPANFLLKASATTFALPGW